MGISRLSGTSWRKMRKGLSVLAWKIFTFHLDLPLNRIEPHKDVCVYPGSKPRKLVSLFLLGSLEKVCCELYILKSRFPDGFRQMNLVMQGISFFLIALLLATCPCACGSVDIAVEGDLPVELDEGTYGAWQSGRQQDAENSGVGCDFLSSSCSTEKGLCCALCWLF